MRPDCDLLKMVDKVQSLLGILLVTELNEARKEAERVRKFYGK